MRRALRGRSSENEDDDDDDKENDNEVEHKSNDDEHNNNPLQALTKFQQTVTEKLPTPLVTVVQTLVNKFLAWRWQLVAFCAGAVLAVGAILVPIYAEVESLSKPVTLLETILGDLQVAYVDPVDTDKLFETGMNAMLRCVHNYETLLLWWWWSVAQ